MSCTSIYVHVYVVDYVLLSGKRHVTFARKQGNLTEIKLGNELT